MRVLKEGGRVAVIAAMRSELGPIVKRLALREEALGAGLAYRGRAGSREVVAAVTSLGPRAAREVTARLLDAYPVDHVLVVGIAGGIDPVLRIGDLVIPEEALDETTGERVHPIPLVDAAPRGTLLTTDTLYNDPASLARLRREGFLAVDMETAAIGAVSEGRGLPWSVFRAVSDLAGDPRIDREVVGLVRPDGSPDPAAVVRFLLTQPWRAIRLAPLARDRRRAIGVSTAALLRALGADAGRS